MESDLYSIYHEFNRKISQAGRGYLNPFEQLEVGYFEELEKCETLYGDLERFGKQTYEEIGLEAEEKVQLKLLKLNDNIYHVINNVMIPNYYGKTSQIDSIIISIYGIFVIEIKNYKGKIVGNEDSEYWGCYYDGVVKAFNKKKISKNLRKELYNPIKQNNTHILALSAILNKHKDIPYYSIIVFNEEAELYVETSTPVIHINNLINLLNKYKIVRINEITVKEIYNKILNSNILNAVNLKKHKEYVNNIKNKKNHILNKNYLSLNYLATLDLIPGIGTRTIEYIQENLDNEILNIDDLIKILLNVKKISSKVLIPTKTELELSYEKALTQINNYKQQGISVIPFYSSIFPKELKMYPNHPMLLFSIGDIACLNSLNRVGILGSNKSSKYASRCAQRFGEICADNNIVLISIACKDYNLSVVKGAIAKKGKVILVTTTQLNLSSDIIYSNYYNEIIKNGGCVISCVRLDGFLNDFRRTQINELFISLIANLIIMDINSKLILDIVKLGFESKRNIAYLDQSKKIEQQEIDKYAKLKNYFSAKPLKDKNDLNNFLNS